MVEMQDAARHCLRNGFDAEIERSRARGVRRDPPVAVATGGERRAPRAVISQSEAEDMFFRRALAPDMAFQRPLPHPEKEIEHVLNAHLP